jgi:hypothetical protein
MGIMPLIRYVTAPVTGEAVKFDGLNEAEIRDFAGPDFLDAAGGRVWVRNAEGPVEVHPGWFLAREEQGPSLIVYAPGAFSRAVPVP